MCKRWRKMNTLGICSVLYLVIVYVVDVCDAECDEYIVVLEESFCPNSKYSYRIRPLKEPEINWDNVTYPCNSTATDLRKEKCLLEFDCESTILDCPRHIKQVHHETHSDIGDTQTTKPIRTEPPDVETRNIPMTEKPTEVPKVTTSNISVTEKPTEAPDVTTSNISVTKKPTEAPDVMTSNISVTEKPTEAPHVTTSTITVTEKSTEAPDITTSNISVIDKSTEAPDVTTSNISVTEKPTEAPDVTTSNITVTGKPTEAPDVTISNISLTEKPTQAPNVTTSNISVTEKPTCTVYEEFKASMYDVNLIYINLNGNQNSSETINQIRRNETLQCYYAETLCVGEMNPENDSFSADKNVTYDHHHKEPAVTLELSINRDETSPVQPIFTGYFPESSNDSSTNYNGNFYYLKTISQICPILKHDNCKQNIQIDIYIKANYIENNTMTKYPNCTKESTTSDNVLHVECKDISFAKYNRHIEYIPRNPSPKQEMFNCQILTSKDQRSEYSKLHFINCSNDTKISNNKTESGDSNITQVLDSKKITIDSILTRNGIEMNNTGISTEKEIINKDSENMVTIVVTENTNNCSHYISLNIDEGKIIDLDVNNKVKIVQNNNIKLLLSNCINNSSINNNEQPPPKAELIIILKTESLNALNLQLFNATDKYKNLKQRILLRCDHPNLNTSSSATSDKTTLQCESIDLELHNITGIEVPSLSQISNDKTANKSKNKSMQDRFTWNCNILELNNTSKKHQKNKLYFDNCFNNININYSTTKSSQNNVTPISDGENRNIDVTKTKGNKMNNSENPSGKNPKNLMKILISEMENNCSNHSYFMIHEGKIIDLDVNKNTERNLQNNIELVLFSCIDVDTSITKESKPDSKVELTIILNSDPLNASNLKQFNGSSKDESNKQRIVLRCYHPNLDLKSNFSSDKTVLHCEPIDLVFNNITGVEISTNVNTNREEVVEDIGNHTKINGEIQTDSRLSKNKTVENNATINNKSHEDNTKVVESKEVQKNIPKTKENHQNNKKSDENKEVQKISINQMFNRKKDIPNSSEQNNIDLRLTERETILIIALLSIICSCILMVIAWRLWPKKREYNPTPTREPPDDEETAF